MLSGLTSARERAKDAAKGHDSGGVHATYVVETDIEHATPRPRKQLAHYIIPIVEYKSRCSGPKAKSERKGPGL